MARARRAPPKKKGAVSPSRSSSTADPLSQQKKDIEDEQRLLVSAVGLLPDDAINERCTEEAGPAPGPTGYTGNDLFAMFKLQKFMHLRGWDFSLKREWGRYNVVVGSAAQWIDEKDRESQWSVAFIRRDDPNDFTPVIGAATDRVNPVKATAIAFLRALMTQQFKEQNDVEGQQRRDAAV